MGVPALFRWLSQKYPKIISSVIEEQAQEIDGETQPVRIAGDNPNGEEFDNLYLDMNGIVHPCSHPEDKPPPANEEEMMVEIFKYTERVVNMVRPRKLLMIAVDGVAPRAKMNQQRSRRFRSAQEAREKDEEKAEFLKLLKGKKSTEEIDDDVHADIAKKTWDSNAITPGTPFMDILAASLRYWIAYKLNTDTAWEKLKIIISDATVPGEGEHKIMEFVRSQRRSPDYDPNTRHVIYGLDADLIMLGLATHEPHFRVLREDVFFQERKKKMCHICGQSGHVAQNCQGSAKVKQGEHDEKQHAEPQKPFIWLHVSILREYLAAELYVQDQPFPFDLERALDDWVFMCFFVGNDFLPHLPSLDIREQGIDTLIAIWRDNIPLMGGYVTKDGHVDLSRVQYILSGLAKQEDSIFKRRKQKEDARERGGKRRKLEQGQHDDSPLPGSDVSVTPQSQSMPKKGKAAPSFDNVPFFEPGKAQSSEARKMTHDMFVNRKTTYQAGEANKSAAAVLKDQLLARKASAEDDNHANHEEPEAVESNGTSTTPNGSGKRKAEVLEEETTAGHASASAKGTPRNNSNGPPIDEVRLWEYGYADRYYEHKFKVDPKDIAFRNKVARSYVEGLCWVLLYYFQGCPSWTWYYPYHYAPFAADFVDLSSMDINFEKGRIFKPFEQLMGVMPAASNHTIPEVFHSLMTDEDSDIVDFYPESFPIDLNGKKMAWQGVALLPFIDEKRLLAAMATRYPMLSKDEVARNEFGKDALLFSTRHPLYEEIALNFYSKSQGAPKYKLSPKTSEGLFGKVEKNEAYLPQSTLSFPLPSGSMPDVDEDQSISVHYQMPLSTNVHKSMLLRGVQMPKPVLGRSEVEATKRRAAHTGRSYGGVPLRNEYSQHGGHNYGQGHNSNGRYNDGGGRGRGGGGGGGGNQHSNGGNINYSNPFAAFLNPSFTPGGGPPPPPHVAAASNWAPPPPSSYHGGAGQNGWDYNRGGRQNQGGGGHRGNNGRGRGHGGQSYGQQGGRGHGGGGGGGGSYNNYNDRNGGYGRY